MRVVMSGVVVTSFALRGWRCAAICRWSASSDELLRVGKPMAAEDAGD
jgi:hypothetical protein